MSGNIHYLSRRRFLSGATAAAGAAILAACGGSSATDTPKPATTTSGTVSAPTAAVPPATTGATAATPAASAPSAVAPSGPVSPVAAAPTVANAPKGGSLTHAIVGTDAKSFHPYLTTDTVSSTYQGYIYGGGLIKYDDNTLDIVGDAAEKFTHFSR